MIEQLLKNSSSQIRFTVLHEKNVEISKNANFDSLDFLKIYTRILEKYKYLDSNMMGFESTVDKQKEDLDETIKIKNDSPPKKPYKITSKVSEKKDNSKKELEKNKNIKNNPLSKTETKKK